MRGRSPSLSVRMLVASAVLALLVAAVFAVLVHAVLSLDDATRAEARSKDVTVATLVLQKNVIDLETGLRGLLLSGNERFLEPWTRARGALDDSIGEFERLAGENAAQRERARRLVREIRLYVEEYSDPLVALAREGSQAAETSVAEGEGARRMEKIRTQFTRFLDAEDELAAASAASANREADRAIALARASRPRRCGGGQSARGGRPVRAARREGARRGR